MTRDIEVLRAWLLVVVVIAAVGATSFPVIYSFSPWHKHLIGRLLMLQGVAFAGALDTTVLFAFWMPQEILVVFWIQAVIFTAIAGSTLALTWGLWRMNHPKKRSFTLLFNKGTYDFLKRFVQVVLPALGLLYFTLAQFWDLPHVDAVMGTLTAVATFLGVCLGISTKEYNNQETKYDGTVAIHDGEEGSTLRITDISAKALATKGEITLKIDR